MAPCARSVRPLAMLATLTLTAAGCSSDDAGPRPITVTREIDVGPGQDKVGATSEERFRSMQPPPAVATPQRELVWDNPPGWTELPPTEMRRANLRPAGHADMECFLSVLPGGGGGVVDNVNRWRQQMGLAAIDVPAVDALPKQLLLGLEGTRLELAGDYTNMGAEKKPGFALLGVIAPFGEQALFAKFTGPAELVKAEQATFDAFVASLRLEEVGGAGLPHGHSADDGHDHGAAGGAADGTDAAGAAAGDAPKGTPPETAPDKNPLGGSNQGVTWTTPAGWTRATDKATRIVTLVPPGAKQTECAVSSLPGTGGGLKSNVDRWRGQIGLAPCTADEFAKLPKLTVCGQEAVLLDLLGTFEDGMTGRSFPQARMLGAIALMADRSLFVKLTGPESEVDEAVKNGFLELCASLKR